MLPTAMPLNWVLLLLDHPVMARRVLRIRSVLLSRVFSATQHGVRDPYGVMVELDFLKKIFLLPQIVKIGQAQGSLNIYENSVINFFSIWSIMKNLYQLLYAWKNLGKFWFLRHVPKCSWPIRLQDFYINYISRTKKIKWKSLVFGMLIQIHWN